MTGSIIAGRYSLTRILGLGGFGSVYLADDLQTSKKVVVKITTSNTEYERAAFQREIALLNRISNPNIVKLLDAGTTEDGNSYLVSEYIEGNTLAQLLMMRGRLPFMEALEITLNIAKALSALHNVYVLHRDIKPSNIMITYGAPETLKLFDFGVVGKLEEGSNKTPAGQIFGTPLYMAPEQARGSRQSAAADIYSLGVTLYEMLYGRLPFHENSIDKLFASKLKGEVTFPPDTSIPQQVKTFVRRCLSTLPEDRPQSAAEVIAEVSKLLSRLKSSSDDIQPPPPPAIQRRKLLVPVIVFAVIASTLAWVSLGGRYQILGIITGVLYAASGIIIGKALHKWLKERRGQAEREAGNLLLSSKSTNSLSMSLALEVDNLICKVNRVDDKILATSLAIMVKEFQEAKEAQFRQAAIMNVVQLLEKLTTRLSPWYVRHEKLIALAVTVLGILSGITTVAKTIVDMKSGK